MSFYKAPEKLVSAGWFLNATVSGEAAAEACPQLPDTNRGKAVLIAFSQLLLNTISCLVLSGIFDEWNKFYHKFYPSLL